MRSGIGVRGKVVVRDLNGKCEHFLQLLTKANLKTWVVWDKNLRGVNGWVQVDGSVRDWTGLWSVQIGLICSHGLDYTTWQLAHQTTTC